MCRSPWGHKELDTTEQQLLFCVGLFVTLLSVARLAPLSMGFPKQEYWSGLLWPSPKNLPPNLQKSFSPTDGTWSFCVSCIAGGFFTR